MLKSDALRLILRNRPLVHNQTPNEWCRQYLRLPGSVLVDRYTPELTPYLVEPVNALADPDCKIMTIMAPIQSGKSVVGEAAACYHIATSTGGDIQWNWEDDSKADARWDKRIDKILRACGPVKARWPSDPTKARRGQVIFPHMNLTVQGQKVSKRLDSDAITLQINEEIHNWEAGRLTKGEGRITAVWNGRQVNISNAGNHGDQLDYAYSRGTQERWGFTCPKCGKWQPWRTARNKDANRKWTKGGLCYDSEGCKRGDWDYDYEALAKTIYYECEHCGHQIHEHARKSLDCSFQGLNPTPLQGHRSFSWDSCAVLHIRWLTLIQWKHQALKALSTGDTAPWRQYVTERECRPWRDDDIPNTHKVRLSDGVRKGATARGDYDTTITTVDCQRGAMNDVPHYWVIVRGYSRGGSFTRATLLHEGRSDTREEVERIAKKYATPPGLVFIDSGDQTEMVYQWCAREGYTPIKGRPGDGFVTERSGDIDEDETRRVRSIWRCDADNPIRVPTPEGYLEMPLVLYAKDGIRNRLQSMRESAQWAWEIPEDVSDDFIKHYAAEESYYTDQGIKQHKQKRARNDLYVCDCYQALGYDIWLQFSEG